jgi:hypothetical protein
VCVRLCPSVRLYVFLICLYVCLSKPFLWFVVKCAKLCVCVCLYLTICLPFFLPLCLSVCLSLSVCVLCVGCQVGVVASSCVRERRLGWKCVKSNRIAKFFMSLYDFRHQQLTWGWAAPNQAWDSHLSGSDLAVFHGWDQYQQKILGCFHSTALKWNKQFWAENLLINLEQN